MMLRWGIFRIAWQIGAGVAAVSLSVYLFGLDLDATLGNWLAADALGPWNLVAGCGAVGLGTAVVRRRVTGLARVFSRYR